MKLAATLSVKKHTVLQRFGLFFFDHKEITIVFWAALVIFGFVSYTTLMQRQGFPNVDVPISIVSGTYFVNDKKIVDQKVAQPASEAIKKIPQVKKVSSQAAKNFFLLTVEYKDGTNSAAGNALVKSALTNSGVVPSTAAIEFKAIDAGRYAEQSDLLISVYSPSNDINIETLQQHAIQVAELFAKVDGVQKAVVLKQVQSGVNPLTGQLQQEQRSFDKFGNHDGSGAVVFYNSVVIGVQAKPSTDALKLYDTVTAKIDDLSKEPSIKDLRMSVSADFAESIRAQVGNLQSNLLEGLVIVIIVSFLIISWRAGLVTALSMATVLLITIAILYATGTSLNTITLFALILSLGLIVDDTTIMVEAIDAANGSSSDKRYLVSQAIKRVARASFSGTITTMLAFTPMLFISGILGNFIRILPISIIISLAVSLLVSLSLVPFLAHFLLHTSKPRKSKRRLNPIPIVERKVAHGLAQLVRSGEHSRLKRYGIGGTALLISFILFMASIPLFGKLKFDIFPSTKDSDQIAVALQYPDGTSILKAQTIAEKANIIIGDTLGKNLKRLSYQNTGSTTNAQAVIELTSYKKRTVKSPQLIANLQQAFSSFNDAKIKVSQIDAGPPKDDYPFAVQIYDENPAKAHALAADMQTYLQGIEVTRVSGTTAHIVRSEIAPNDYITRSTSKQYIQLKAGFDADDVSALVNQAQSVVKNHFTASKLKDFGMEPSQLVFDFGNESNNQDSFKSMLLAFPILFVLMFILLLFQFKSLLQPVLIFMAIPFSFFGVALGLYKTHNPLSFFVMVGFFALIGIAVNNTILLTDYANQSKAEGKNKYEAVADALQARFRPLIATSITSVVALIPLAISDPFWESLSVTLIFGLLSSTFLVVIAFPYLYLLGEWLRMIGHAWWIRKLWKPLQILLDVVFLPIRLLRFALWLTFSWRKT